MKPWIRTIGNDNTYSYVRWEEVVQVEILSENDGKLLVKLFLRLLENHRLFDAGTVFDQSVAKEIAEEMKKTS